MLAQANLHRMRGQWDEAIAVCMDAMRLSPNDPTAHSLLGDIYSDQGNLDEAIRWYCMALDLKPNSRADRAKLSRLVEAKRQSLVAADQKDPHVTLRLRRRVSLLPGEHALKHGRVWKADKLVRNFAIGAFILMVLVILAAPIVNYERRQHPDALGAMAMAGRQINAAPVYLQPVVPATKGLSGESLASAGPTTLRDPFDQKLVDGLRSDTPLLYDGIQIADAQSDPRAGRITLTFLDNPGNAPASDLRAQILSNSLRLATAAAERTTGSSYSQFTIRCLLLTAPQSGDSGAMPPMTDTPITATTPLVFVADIGRSAIPSTDPGQQSVANMQALFNSPWFAPSLQ